MLSLGETWIWEMRILVEIHGFSPKELIPCIPWISMVSHGLGDYPWGSFISLGTPVHPLIGGVPTSAGGSERGVQNTPYMPP